MRTRTALVLLLTSVGVYAAVAGERPIGAAARLPTAGLRANGRYVDFAPADGERVDRNPPPLTWPWNPPPQLADEPQSWSFRLVVARDANLAHAVHTETIRFNAFAEMPSLENGQGYFWRVQWLDAQGRVAYTSPVRRFEVAADAKRYDLSVLRHLPKTGHPCFAVRPEDLPALRQLRDRDTLYGQAAKVCLEKARQIADWGKLTEPPGWSFCPQIYTLASGHLLWGDTDQRFAALGIEGLRRACREKVQRPETLEGGSYTGNLHTMMLLAAYDWLHDAMTDPQRRECADELAARVQSMAEGGLVCLQRATGSRDASHPLELLALGTAGAWVLHEEHPELQPALRLGLNYFLAQPGPYSEGLGWTEGRGYGRSHLLYQSLQLLAPIQVGLRIPMAEYGRWGNIARFFAELTPVGEDRQPFGDGGAYWRGGWGFPVILTAALVGDAETYHRLARLGEKRHFAWIDSRVDYGPEAPTLAHYFPPLGEAPLRARTRWLAPEAGFVVEHTDSRDATNSVGFVFKCSPMGCSNHCHADQGSFALYAWGQLLTGNTGSYGGGSYGTGQDLHFNKHTISKNSLLINGSGQAHCSKSNLLRPFQARIAAYHADNEYVYTCGSLANCYPPEARVKSAFRHVLFVRGRYFVMFDDVELTEPGTVGWLYHLPDGAAVDSLAGGALDYHAGPVKVVFRMAGEDLAATASDRAAGDDGVDYSREQKAPATHVRFARSQPAVRQQFLAVIVPFRDDAPKVEFADARHVRVTCDGKSELTGFGSEAHDTVDYQAIQAGETPSQLDGDERRRAVPGK